MKIESVSKDENHYAIFRDDGYIFVQKRFPVSATDSPLSPDEEIIVALCDKICKSSVTGIE
jgi:hypothetical protein